jgi:hypothetical protein
VSLVLVKSQATYQVSKVLVVGTRVEHQPFKNQIEKRPFSIDDTKWTSRARTVGPCGRVVTLGKATLVTEHSAYLVLYLTGHAKLALGCLEHTCARVTLPLNAPTTRPLRPAS